MTRDALATRTRILTAASLEFSERGMAGARIERIAAAAAANVRLIYSHFGSKEALFATVLDVELTAMHEAVPVDVDDLAGWVGRLFDYHRTHPQGVRISVWRELERPDLGPDLSRLYEEKVTAMTVTPRQGTAAVDLLVILFGLAQSWFFTPTGLLSADGSDPRSSARVELHRRAIVNAASALSRDT